MKIKRNILVCLYLALSVILSLTSCQNKEPEILDYYQEIPELTQSQLVYDMVIDSKGYKWCASSAGLLKFDGYKVTKYTKSDGLASDTLWCLAIDTNNVIWSINHNDKITRFDGNNFTTKNIYDPQAIMVDKKNTLWVAYHLGLMCFDGVKWTNYETNYANSNAWAKALFEGQDNNLLLITENNGLLEFKNGSFTKIESINSLPSWKINSIAYDKTSKITYYATNGNGLMVYNQGVYSYINLGKNIEDNIVHTLKVDKKGQVWMGTETGFCLYNTKLMYYKPPKLPAAPIKNFVLDIESNPWIVCYSIVFKLIQH